MGNKSESEIRLEKLEELKKRGVNPYPAQTPAHTVIEAVRDGKEGNTVATVGRITALRGHGKSVFMDLFDDDHRIQLFFSQAEVGDEEFELLSLLDIGDYLWTAGELFLTKSGELTIKVKEFQLLSKCLLPIPDAWQGLTDMETRYRQRTLDFKINGQARRIIETRAQIIETIRQFFARHGFLEVSTPVLQPIPGGAAAKPFSTKYNALDAEFFLRIAPELYLKRLVAGGFNRVFEIGPSFRNEGLSPMHNPEFYSAEAYWAYQDYLGFMRATQQLIQGLVKKIHGSLNINYQGQKLNFAGDFAVKKYVDVIKGETGLDILALDNFEKLDEAVKKKNIKFEGQKITVWSELVDELFKKVCRTNIVQPTFVIDYPLELQPLAKVHRDNPKLAEQFQLIVAGGFELVKAYSELNDPLDQEKRFKEQVKMREQGWDEAQLLDENFVESLKFGMPPTSGWGLGIDRLTMVLTDQHSIKEVISFPTLRPKN